MEMILILLITLSTLFYLYMTRKYDHWRKKGIPFIPPVPMIGNFLDCFLLRVTIGDLLKNIYKSSTDDVLGMYVFDRPYLLIRNPDLIKSILVSDFNIFHNRAVADNEAADPIGSNTLFVVKNPEWRKLRQNISHVFSSAKLKAMLPLITSVGDNLIKYIGEKVVNKGSFDAREIMAKYSTDVITSCAFGVDARCFEDENAAFRQAGRQVFGFTTINRAIHMGAYFLSPLAVKLFGLKFYHPAAANFLRTVFLETTEQRKKMNVKRNDLIDILMEINERNITNDECKPLEGDRLVAQAAVFFGAGYESSSATVAATLFELCYQPDLQTLLRNEIISTLAKYDNEITADAINSMKYLHMCVSETLRKYPILPFLDRRAMEDYTIPGSNTVIDKGTPVYISLLGLHYDPNYFPEPTKYDPERFNEGNSKNIVPYTYLPFGAGPHNCIGERFGIMSVKLGIITTLSKFVVECTDKSKYPVTFSTNAFLLKPKYGLHMSFKEFK